jgi:hypothetical protein
MMRPSEGGRSGRDMARRAYEKTQKENPHQLPVKQHVLPARSIARFANSGGMVQQHNLATQQTRAAGPVTQCFAPCARGICGQSEAS